jgi:hypothetical protein
MFAASLALLAHEFQGPERGLALGIWGSHHRRRARGRARCRSLFAAAVLLGAFVAIERRSTSPMLSLSLFRIPAFTGTAHVAFAQSVALYPLFLFLALYFQELLELSPTETGVRLLPIIRMADSPAVGLIAGLNAIFLVAAVVVVVTAVVAWPLLGRLRSST